ncbi:MAG: hypothetical protein ABIH86_01630 [Planctomycetota bacterium]
MTRDEIERRLDADSGYAAKLYAAVNAIPVPIASDRWISTDVLISRVRDETQTDRRLNRVVSDLPVPYPSDQAWASASGSLLKAVKDSETSVPAVPGIPDDRWNAVWKNIETAIEPKANQASSAKLERKSIIALPRRFLSARSALALAASALMIASVAVVLFKGEPSIAPQTAAPSTELMSAGQNGPGVSTAGAKTIVTPAGQVILLKHTIAPENAQPVESPAIETTGDSQSGVELKSATVKTGAPTILIYSVEPVGLSNTNAAPQPAGSKNNGQDKND